MNSRPVRIEALSVRDCFFMKAIQFLPLGTRGNCTRLASAGCMRALRRSTSPRCVSVLRVQPIDPRDQGPCIDEEFHDMSLPYRVSSPRSGYFLVPLDTATEKSNSGSKERVPLPCGPFQGGLSKSLFQGEPFALSGLEEELVGLLVDFGLNNFASHATCKDATFTCYPAIRSPTDDTRRPTRHQEERIDRNARMKETMLTTSPGRARKRAGIQASLDLKSHAEAARKAPSGAPSPPIDM